VMDGLLCVHESLLSETSSKMCSGVAGARNAECYTVSETYWLDLKCESTDGR
jgi:hypothetical protein